MWGSVCVERDGKTRERTCVKCWRGDVVKYERNYALDV